MKPLTFVIISIGFLVSTFTTDAGPVSLPPVNLGDTSFADGIANPGWFLEETLNFYHADQFNDSNSRQLDGQNKLATISAVTHLAYFSKYKLWGGYLGAEFLVPLVDLDLDTGFQPRDRERGVGDISLNPFMLQWNDQTLFGKPFFHRFDLAMVLPTGDYDSLRAVNAGNNLFSLNPYHAFTIFPAPKLEFSVRLHYLWNSENDRPYSGLHAQRTQPGQAFHANFATSYEILKNLRVGINGYALQQFTDDQVDGRNLLNSEERVFGIGPGLVFQQDKLWVYLNCYFETGAENRPEGTKVTFRVARAF